MLQDSFPQLIRSTYNCKILVSASYRARQTFSGKGITPAIFLSQFYRNTGYSNPLQVSYGLKNQKQIKPMPDFVPIDLQQYQHFSDEAIAKYIKTKLQKSQVKYQKCSSKQVFKNRGTVQSYLNNQNFHWFYQANQAFYHGLLLNKDHYRISTLQQPIGITMILQVDSQKGCKQQFQQLQKQTTNLMKKLYMINPSQMKAIKISVVILFDSKKDKTIQQAFAYTDILKKDYKVDQNLICRLQLNGKQAQDVTLWSMYTRPIFNYPYKLKPSDPVMIISMDMHQHLKKMIFHHKDQIRQNLQIRMDYLVRKYDQFSALKNRLLGFFKGTNPSDKNYIVQQKQTRQLADKFFLLQDYRRACDTYRFLSKKMQNRDKQIQTQIACMIQLCIGMGKYHSLKIKDDPFGSIQKHAQRILKTYSMMNQNQLLRYIIFLMYMFHNFRVYHKDFIKKCYYRYLKVAIGEQKNPLGCLTVLVHQQYACLSLLTRNIDYRKYCYELTRVAWKFTSLRIHQHALRCLILVHSLYQGTFIVIQKYILIQLSKVYLQMRNYQQALNYMKTAWKIHIKKNQNTQFDNKHFLNNHMKILQEIQRVRPQLILKDGVINVAVPILSNINIQVFDQMLQNDDKSGIKWQKIGQAFTDNKDMLSMGLNKNNLIKMFKQCDKFSAEQKSLLYQLKNSNPTIPILKRNSRVAYKGQPLKISFEMINPLNSDIEVENVMFKLKNSQNFSFENDIEIIGQKIRKSQIKSSQRVTFEYTIIPKKQCFIQLDKIEWMLMKILSQYQLDLTRQDIQNCYYKVNVIENTGLLNVKLHNSHSFYYEGEFTQIFLDFVNQGSTDIEQIFMAVGDYDIFGFKYASLLSNRNINKTNKSFLKSSQSYKLKLEIKIPLLSEKIQSGQYNSNQKLIFLYKTSSGFRYKRLIWNLNIHRIAQIQNVCCQRISTHLHILTFQSSDVNTEKNLQIDWMMVRKNFTIVKQQVANLKNNSIHYYFLKFGNDFQRQMYQVKFQKKNQFNNNNNNLLSNSSSNIVSSKRIYPTQFLNKIWENQIEKPEVTNVTSLKKLNSEQFQSEKNIMKQVFSQKTKSQKKLVEKVSKENSAKQEDDSNKIQFCFLWSAGNSKSTADMRKGIIYLPKLGITYDRSLIQSSSQSNSTVQTNRSMLGSGIFMIPQKSMSGQNLSLATLPFNFRITFDNYIQNSFNNNPVLQVPVEIMLKNIFYKQKLSIKIYFQQQKDVDSSWQGFVQRQIQLEQGQQVKLKLKFITMRGGIFNFSDSIRYKISISYQDDTVSVGKGLQIKHSNYESLYLEVKDTDIEENKLKKERQQEDMFKDMFKKQKKTEQVCQSNISSYTIVDTKKQQTKSSKISGDMQDFMNFQFDSNLDKPKLQKTSSASNIQTQNKTSTKTKGLQDDLFSQIMNESSSQVINNNQPTFDNDLI